MKTKLTMAFLLFVGIVLNGFAQTSDAEAEALINLFGVQKREAIAQLVPVSGKDSVAFWKIYDEYDKATKAQASPGSSSTKRLLYHIAT